MIVSALRPGPNGSPGSKVLPVKVIRGEVDLRAVERRLNCIDGVPRRRRRSRPFEAGGVLQGHAHLSRMGLSSAVPDPSLVFELAVTPFVTSGRSRRWGGAGVRPMAAAGRARDHDLAVGLDHHPAGDVVIAAGRAAAEVEGDELHARAAIERRVDGAVRVEPGDREIPVAERARWRCRRRRTCRRAASRSSPYSAFVPPTAPNGGRALPPLPKVGSSVASRSRRSSDSRLHRPLAIGTARRPPSDAGFDRFMRILLAEVGVIASSSPEDETGSPGRAIPDRSHPRSVST